MKNLKKIIVAASLCAAIGATAIAGTLAYFTDTDEATNVFTAGDLDIDLIEPDWSDTNGEGILPGDTVAKNPKVTNLGNVPAYLQMTLTVPKFVYENSDLNGVGSDKILFEINNRWTEVGTAELSADGTEYTLTYRYTDGAGNYYAAGAGETEALFNQVQFLGTLTNDDMDAIYGSEGAENFTFDLKAYAIQAENVTGDTDAIDALFVANF